MSRRWQQSSSSKAGCALFILRRSLSPQTAGTAPLNRQRDLGTVSHSSLALGDEEVAEQHLSGGRQAGRQDLPLSVKGTAASRAATHCLKRDDDLKATSSVNFPPGSDGDKYNRRKNKTKNKTCFYRYLTRNVLKMQDVPLQAKSSCS